MQKLLFFGIVSLLLFSCGAKEKTSLENDLSNAEIYIDVVDSVIVGFLGQLELADIHEASEQFLFWEYRRNLFLVTDKDGQTISEFSKLRDSPDFGQMFGFLPFFIDAETIGLLTVNKLFMYSLSGDLLRAIRFENPYEWRSQIYRAANRAFPFSIIGVQGFIYPLMGPPNPPSIDNPEFPDLKEFRAVHWLDLKSEELHPWIGYEPNSRFLLGKPHHMLAKSPIISVDQNDVFVTYVQEPIVRRYTWKNGAMDLVNEFPLLPEEFHDQDPNKVDMDDMIDRTNFELDGMEAARMLFIHADGDELFTMYNPGKKEEDMQRFTVERTPDGGLMIGGMKRVNRELEPKDKLQYFRNGKKIGRDIELLPQFDKLMLGKGPYLWFSRDIRKDEEESDFVIFYKARVKEKN